MDTLRINPALLRKAEQQARLRNINLSEAVESFIRRFISQDADEDKKVKVTSFVSQLGVDLNLPPDFDEREAYRKHLDEKYQ